MAQPTLEQLARRLDRVERENQQIRWVRSVLLCAVAAVFVMGQGRPYVAKVVEAERFVLRDATGGTVAVLGSGLGKRATYSGLFLLDRHGNPRAELVLSAERGVPFLVLRDAGGKVRANVFADENGTEILLHPAGTDHIGSASLAVTKYKDEMHAGVHLTGANGKGDASLKIGGPWSGLSVADKTNRVRSKVAVQEPDGAPSLELFDDLGKVRAVVGNVTLETTSTGALEQRPPSSLVLFDKDGKVMWKAP